MGTIVATVLGLLIWIVLWALGVNSIDGFMIAIVITLVALTGRMLSPYLPGNRQ